MNGTLWTGRRCAFLASVGMSTWLAASLFGALHVRAQSQGVEARPTRRITAVRVNPHPPNLDGVIDDPAWQTAVFTSDFLQKDPQEGQPARERTELAVVYDDHAVYIGARMHCQSPERIISIVSRRDNPGTSERIIVSLDTYHDGRTAYTFGVTASGVRVDYYHPVDQEYQRDYNFNPVWEAAVTRQADGWTAEMRIPFTQLRFKNQDAQVWGVNINRWVPSVNEDSYWVLIPKSETGWSSKMGEIVGIEGVRPSRRLEVLPYAASDARLKEGEPGDPFHDERDFGGRVGGDFKAGVGPNLTLEGTVNPDFGQVEADPAEVNLTVYETFFDERRPFFTERSELFSGGGAGYFYSRRIGAPPHHDPEADFVEKPRNTSILGATKLTGRLNSGLSVGVLGAVTERERAKLFDEATGETSEVEVEPFAGYGVVRLQQEFGKEHSTAGIILTGVERDVESGETLGDLLARRALAGGADWNLRFREGRYQLGGNAGFSRVEGSGEAIGGVQQSPRRYFQRPDAGHVEFDSTRTSLAGWTGGLYAEKNGGKHWLGGVSVYAESPGFEINDVGSLGSADDVETWMWWNYRENTPGKRVHNWTLGGNLGLGWNFDSDRQLSYGNVWHSMTFKNFMGAEVGVEGSPRILSDDLTRGGPLMERSANGAAWLSVWSGPRRKTTWNAFAVYAGNEIGGWHYRLTGSVTFRPGSRWEFSLEPWWNQELTTRQYVTTLDGGRPETFGQRYVFAHIERSQLFVRMRLNYAFTPDLTLEYYAEPFAASGRYENFGELLAARSRDLRKYGTGGTTITETSDGVYTVTDGADTFEIERPDFNVLSFRSNVVLRWEWTRGSTLFLVWQQSREDAEETGSIVRPSRLWDARGAHGENFLAVKVTYWLPI